MTLRTRYFLVAGGWILGGLASAGSNAGSKTASPVPAEQSFAPPSKETVKRREATYALAQARSPLSIPPLMQALSDADAKVREIAVQGLAAMNATPAAPAITALLLKDSDPAVREEAAKALKQFKLPDSQTAFLSSLKDPIPSVRVLSVEALAESSAPEARAAILKAAKDPAPEVRRTVMSVYAKTSDPSVVPALTAALQDPDPAVRANAAQAIHFYAKLNSPKELEALLQDPDATVRASAARSLAQMGSERGLEAALTLAKSGEGAARLIAVDALGYMQNVEAKALLGELSAQNADPILRDGAKLALQRQAMKRKS